MQEIEQTQVDPVTVERDIPDPSAEGVMVDAPELQSSLSNVADTFDVTGFKCVKCRLVHMHDTMKHRLSDTFDVSDDIASEMEYNSVCHCGPHEAARRGDELGIDEDRAESIAGDAPIPTNIRQQIDTEVGTL